MSAIYTWWIGVDVPRPRVLDLVQRQVAAAFEIPVRRWEAPLRPVDTLDVRRQQHLSTSILRWMKMHRPPEARKILGLTDVDLFIPVLTFVYGEAQLGGPCAVVSAARLGPPLGGIDGELAAARLAKEAVHELGHTFGLVHCSSPRCVMSRSVNLTAVDGKSSTFCADCRLDYLERLSLLEADHE
jgi:archaemetzincin